MTAAKLGARLCAFSFALFISGCDEAKVVEFNTEGEVAAKRLGYHDPVRSWGCMIDYGDNTENVTKNGSSISVVVDVSKDGRAHFKELGPLSAVRGRPGPPIPTPACAELARKAVSTWRYKPFESYGHPVVGRIVEQLTFYPPEERLPHPVAFPKVASNSVIVIELRRSSCLGSCPNYLVEAHEDGAVAFEGYENTIFHGAKTLQVSRSRILKLVEHFRDVDFYSLKDEYTGCSDTSSAEISISIDAQKKTVLDVCGELFGMPSSVGRLEDDVATLAQGLARK